MLKKPTRFMDLKIAEGETAGRVVVASMIEVGDVYYSQHFRWVVRFGECFDGECFDSSNGFVPFSDEAFRVRFSPLEPASSEALACAADIRARQVSIVDRSHVNYVVGPG